MRSLLFTVSILMFLSLTGQDYKPLVVEGNSWSTVGWSWGYGWTEYYFIEGDTTINSINYKKVYKTPDSLFQNNVAFWGGIREDTLNREVYYYRAEWTGENRMYKFGLDINDTVSVWSLECGPYIARVIDKDTITDLFGIERTRMQMEFYGSGWTYDEYWIEGIGSTLGLLSAGNFMCIADLNFELLCFSKNNGLYYMNPLYDTCYITQVGITDSRKLKEVIRIIPNPVVSKSYIQLPENIGIQKIHIYDSFGRLVLEPAIDNPYISNRSLKPGIYFLVVKSDNNELLKSKFIIR